jgi:hypothetical protein
MKYLTDQQETMRTFTSNDEDRIDLKRHDVQAPEAQLGEKIQ